jgi:hypothetical protein
MLAPVDLWQDLFHQIEDAADRTTQGTSFRALLSRGDLCTSLANPPAGQPKYGCFQGPFWNFLPFERVHHWKRAERPIALDSEVAQAQTPPYPPTAPVLVAPAPPPGPQAEIPPPASTGAFRRGFRYWRSLSPRFAGGAV